MLKINFQENAERQFSIIITGDLETLTSTKAIDMNSKGIAALCADFCDIDSNLADKPD